MDKRKFIKISSLGALGIAISPTLAMCKTKTEKGEEAQIALNENGRLRVAHIGVGNMGAADLKAISSHELVDMVALCDVDDRRAAGTYKLHPKAKKYKDVRKVYDKHLKEIDAVMVATPDHMHATIALPFMRAKKHAYVEKPLSHNINEARLMTQVAKENGIITQMGNQGASSAGSRTAKEKSPTNPHIWLTPPKVGWVSG